MTDPGCRPRISGRAIPVEAPEGFRVIAHRGASAYAPENTMAAFALAAQMGIGEIELDVRLTADRRVVVCHDRDLGRFGYPEIVIAEATLAELKQLDLGSWFSPYHFRDEPLVTLDEVFDAFGGSFTYHVELKVEADPNPLVAEVLAVIEDHDLEDSVVLTSFSADALGEVMKRRPEARTTLLVRAGEATEEIFRTAASTGAALLGLSARDAEAGVVRTARRFVGGVRAHGVKTWDDLFRVLDSGFDGTTLDWPDRVVVRQS